MELDKKHGITQWSDATKTDMVHLDEYDTFKELGKYSSSPVGYKKIRIYLFYDVKHDGRNKYKLVADGHITDILVESVYYGVVYLCVFQLLLFIDDINRTETRDVYIGNTYLEARTLDKVYIISCTEFVDREGHILNFSKELYSLPSCGFICHEIFAGCLRDI